MSDEEASDKAPDEQKNDSVFDFLYYDRQRVGSFLAQFDDSGHLQQVKASDSASKGTKRGLKIGAGASYFGTGGNLNFERSPGEHGVEATERIYDPLWSNALTLLDYLESANLICRDVAAGHLTATFGTLSVLRELMLSEDPMCGAELMRVLKIKSGTMYPMLARLKADGFIEHVATLAHPAQPDSHFYQATANTSWKCPVNGCDALD